MLAIKPEGLKTKYVKKNNFQVQFFTHQSGWIFHLEPLKKFKTFVPLTLSRWISSSLRVCKRYLPYCVGIETTNVNGVSLIPVKKRSRSCRDVLLYNEFKNKLYEYALGVV